MTRLFLFFALLHGVPLGFMGSARAERGKAVMEVERFSEAVSQFSRAVEQGDRKAAFRRFAALLKAGPGREIIQRLGELPGTRQLFMMTFPKNVDWSPILSPDGTRFVYLGWQRSQAATHGRLYLVDIEAGSESPLTSPDFDAVSPQWSPDGRRVLFESFREDTNGDGRISKQDRRSVWTVEVSSGQERQWVDAAYENYQPVWMPDGQGIVWLSARRDVNGDGVIDRRDGWGVYRMAKAGAEAVELVSPEVGLSDPRPSPNGQWIVFQRRFGTQRGLAAVSAAGGSVVTLTPESAESEFAAFHPQGEAVAAWVRSRDTNRDGQVDVFDRPALWVIPLAHPQDRKVVWEEAAEVGKVAFSPDGTSLALSVGRGDKARKGIVLVALGATGEPVPIVGSDYDHEVVAFYPDGRKLLFQSWRQDTNADGRIDLLDVPSLYLVDVAGTPLVKVGTVIRSDGSCTRVVEMVTDALFMEAVERHLKLFTGTRWQAGAVEDGAYRVKIVGEFHVPSEMAYPDTPVAWSSRSTWRTVTAKFQERLLPLQEGTPPESPLLAFAAEMSRVMARPLLLHVWVTVPGRITGTNGTPKGQTVEWLVPLHQLAARREAAEMWVEYQATNWLVLGLGLLGLLAVGGGGGYRWWTVHRTQRARQAASAREYADAHQYLGLALAKKGLYDDALVEYREALKHGPDIGSIHLHMASALALKGDEKGARESLARALKLDPSLQAVVSAAPELRGLQESG